MHIILSIYVSVEANSALWKHLGGWLVVLFPLKPKKKNEYRIGALCIHQDTSNGLRPQKSNVRSGISVYIVYTT